MVKNRCILVGPWSLILTAAAVAGEEAELPIFTDITHGAGIHATHRFGDDDLSNIVEGTGAGAALLDYNGDGWLDIYLLNGCWLRDRGLLEP